MKLFGKTAALVSGAALLVVGLTGCTPAAPTVAAVITATDAAMSKTGVTAYITAASADAPDLTGFNPKANGYLSVIASGNTPDTYAIDPGFAVSDRTWGELKVLLTAKVGPIKAHKVGLITTDYEQVLHIVSIKDTSADANHVARAVTFDNKVTITVTMTLKDGAVTKIDQKTTGFDTSNAYDEATLQPTGGCYYYSTVPCATHIDFKYDTTGVDKYIALVAGGDATDALVSAMNKSLKKGGPNFDVEQFFLDKSTRHSPMLSGFYGEWLDGTHTAVVISFDEGRREVVQIEKGIITRVGPRGVACGEGSHCTAAEANAISWADIKYPTSK
jgi:hypothetical protein